MLPAGYNLSDFNRKRRTLILFSNGEEVELNDKWDPLQVRQTLHPEPADRWSGFTEIFLERDPPIFKPKLRINGQTSPSTVLDKERLQAERHDQAATPLRMSDALLLLTRTSHRLSQMCGRKLQIFGSGITGSCALNYLCRAVVQEDPE